MTAVVRLSTGLALRFSALLVAMLLLTSQVGGGRAEATASSLWSEQFCAGNGTVTLVLTWGPVHSFVHEEWVDVSPFDGSWADGTFAHSGVLRGPVNKLRWEGFLPGTTYYFRVSQVSADGYWYPSPTFTVKTAPCSSTLPLDIVGLDNGANGHGTNGANGNGTNGNGTNGNGPNGNGANGSAPKPTIDSDDTPSIP
jgi:hypothetical protein